MSTAEQHISPDLLTVAQMAQRLHKSVRWLYGEIAARRVPHIRIGRSIYFTPEHYAQILADREQPAVSTGNGFGLTDRSRAVSA